LSAVANGVDSAGMGREVLTGARQFTRCGLRVNISMT
jgi:hypothetical protein